MISAHEPPATGTIHGTFTYAHGDSIPVELAVFEEGEHEGEIDTRALARTIRRSATPLALELWTDWTFRVIDTDGARVGTLEVHAGAGA